MALHHDLVRLPRPAHEPGTGIYRAGSARTQRLRRQETHHSLLHTPAKPSVLNAGSLRDPSTSDPTGWKAFIAYNRRDIEVALTIHDRLEAFPVPYTEWATYAIDQRINDRGIFLDTTLVDRAVECDRQHRAATLARAQQLTGLENPNSPIQLKEWLADHSFELRSLTKAEVATALDTATGKVREALKLRGELAKSSVRKYEAMQHVAGRDGRGRGFLQFYVQAAPAGWLFVDCHGEERHWLSSGH